MGCYLGLNIDTKRELSFSIYGLNVENLPPVADHKDMADVTFDMLSEWQQEQYGGAASVAALVKAVYRIHQLNSSFVVDLWWWLHNEL